MYETFMTCLVEKEYDPWRILQARDCPVILQQPLFSNPLGFRKNFSRLKHHSLLDFSFKDAIRALLKSFFWSVNKPISKAAIAPAMATMVVGTFETTEMKTKNNQHPDKKGN